MLHRQMNEVASSTRINSNPAPGKTGILSSTGNCNANNKRVQLNDTYDIHEYFQPSMESTVHSADASKIGIRLDQKDLPHNPTHVERQDRPIQNTADGRRPSNTYTSADLGKTVRSWNVKFNGSSGIDVEEFLRRVKECMESARLSEPELLGSMSELLTGTALRWYRNYKNSWHDWQAFCANARRFFGVTQYFQERLQTEVSTRTQGSAEPVAEYIICAHGLINQIEGKWTPEQQLEQLYQNMWPKLKKLVPRERVTSVDRLVELARTQERILKDEQSYKEPPPPEEVFWSEFACKVRKKKKARQAKRSPLHLGHLPSVLGKREGEQVGEVAIAPLAETSNQKAEPTKFIVGQEDSLSECSSFQGENLDHRAPLPPHPRWWTVAKVGEFKIRALIDSGASRTCFGPVGLQVATHMGIEVVPCSGTSISGADGQLIRLTAQAKIRIKVANKTRELVVFMANSLDYDCVLGADWHVLFYAMVDPRTHELYFNKVKVCKVEFDCNNSTSTVGLTAIGLEGPTPDEEKVLEEILARCLPVNDESSLIGCTDLIEHEIEVTCQRPIKQRCYPVLKKLEDIMYEQLDDMIRQGIVKPSKSSWASPVVMVKKANGKYRFCIDYRKLNAVTKVSARPIPNMDSILRKLRTARYITTLDLSQAYHQVRMKEEHRHLTAFAVPGRGLYEWVRMAFGLAGAPATFQSLMDSIIGPDLEPYAFAYLDDIIIATSTFEQHKEVLADVLTRLTKAGLTINREKSHFCCQEVKYLGVLVDRDGYRPDPEKIDPIINFPTPKTLKQLRTFLGAASWYRKFIDNFATIAEPLTGLTRKETKFTWAEEQIEAFEKLKTMIASAPMLARPVPGDDVFTIHTDASDSGIGAVLTQMLEGEERVLEFASRTMSPAKRNYSVTEHKHSNWDENVAEITFAYNSAVQDSTGASLAFLNFGRQPRIANSLRFREEQEEAENIDEEVQAKWTDHLAKVHEFYNTINERIKRAQEKQAKYYNKKHREVDLQVRELVLRRNRILSNAANQVAAKLAPKFYGPLIITAKIGTNIYELADRQGVPEGPTHVKDLKRFHGNSDEFERDDGEIEVDDEDEQAEIQESTEEMHQEASSQEQQEEEKQIARPQENQIEKGPRPR
ncbi:unnamed protein product [Trichogramma brassicae]|uniref:RNA-directed DNA polymerase n=1 Tax=Trichogramma brassicae TaxID=86971 RepID=A0A6H5J3M8_9HYME|nr:unnamed protein product [Trichogramma brassicae]